LAKQMSDRGKIGKVLYVKYSGIKITQNSTIFKIG
jgi:hypothetical protein